jgi:hypothetical protein
MEKAPRERTQNEILFHLVILVKSLHKQIFKLCLVVSTSPAQGEAVDVSQNSQKIVKPRPVVPMGYIANEE